MEKKKKKYSLIILVQLQQLLILLCCYYTADATLVRSVTLLISKWRVTGASSVANVKLKSSSASRVESFLQNMSTLVGGRGCLSNTTIGDDARERGQASRTTTRGRGGRNNYCFNTHSIPPTTLKCSEVARWARLIACGGDMSPVGPLDDAEPPGAAPSRPCQEIPADFGLPNKFVGRTSLIARRGGA